MSDELETEEVETSEVLMVYKQLIYLLLKGMPYSYYLLSHAIHVTAAHFNITNSLGELSVSCSLHHHHYTIHLVYTYH